MVVCWIIFTAIIAIVLIFAKPTQKELVPTSTPSQSTNKQIDKTKQRPTFIKATNVRGLILKNNTATGDVDFADLENVTDIEASGNKHTTPDNSEKNR